MTSRKLLIDTNVFIGLEDQKQVAPEFAKLQELCGRYGVRIFVHEAALDDIGRDLDIVRRDISLSKVRKFELLNGISAPSTAELEARFGPLKRPNDKVDAALLHALDINAVDFLISQDQGIHSRARHYQPSLTNRVLFVVDAVSWLRATFEPKQIKLPLVAEVPAHAISLKDEIFDSLREGYPKFDDWWRNKCVAEHRPCWIVTIGGDLAGLVVRKDESHADAKTIHLGPKILKVCTFKVKPKYRGEKLGELLLKQILWFSQSNGYDLVYVTTFDDQKVLIAVLKYFGFQMTGRNVMNEGIYEKPLFRERLIPEPDADLLELARINYPRFVARPPSEAYWVPIEGRWHNILFPELATTPQGDLFTGLDASLPSSMPRTPGNTIRKVYLCRAKTRTLRPGDVLAFYRSKSPGYDQSQSLTTIGIVERVQEATNLEALVQLTGKRSVYSETQLSDFGASTEKPIKVIDFLLIGHLSPSLHLAQLQREGIVNGHPPQSIAHLTPGRFAPIRSRMDFGFEV